MQALFEIENKRQNLRRICEERSKKLRQVWEDFSAARDKGKFSFDKYHKPDDQYVEFCSKCVATSVLQDIEIHYLEREHYKNLLRTEQAASTKEERLDDEYIMNIVRQVTQQIEKKVKRAQIDYGKANKMKHELKDPWFSQK